MQINNFVALFYTLAFIVPGFIADTVYRKIVALRSYEPKENLFLRYLTISAVNYGLWSWLIFLISRPEVSAQHPLLTSLCWELIIFISPLILGLIYGALSQKRIIERLMSKMRLTAISPVATSWDYKFSRTRKPRWILVTLTDGSTVAGYWGNESFASSDGKLRDIYIERVYRVQGDGKPWLSPPNNNDGIWLPGKLIKSIEFFYVEVPNE